jgi:hypothetical protein
MGKDPAVLFYTSDFLTGTAFFTKAQRGEYITLLCEQHQLWSIPEEHLIEVCGSLESPVAKKFKKDKDGTWYQNRMREETIRRKKYGQSRRENAGVRWNKKGKPLSKKKIDPMHMYKHMDMHMGTETRTETDTITEREVRFKQEVNSFTEYDQKLRDDFIRHWTEKNKSGKKMKFEMNKTFEIKKRLVTWKNNNEKWFVNSGSNKKQYGRQELTKEILHEQMSFLKDEPDE